MIVKILIGVGLGAVAGGILGSFRSCVSGACPLTANPTRGALFGGLMGVLLALSLSGQPSTAPEESASPAEQEPAAAAHAALETITSQEELEALASGDLPVAVVFSAPWCPACTRYEPAAASVAASGAGRWRIVKVDTDRAPALAAAYNVRYLPTTVVLAGGREVNRFTGARSARDLAAILDAD